MKKKRFLQLIAQRIGSDGMLGKKALLCTEKFSKVKNSAKIKLSLIGYNMKTLKTLNSAF